MVRLTYEQRRLVIVEAGLAVARRDGLLAVTHENVAERCRIDTSVGTVRRYFSSKVLLWRAVADAEPTGELRREHWEYLA